MRKELKVHATGCCRRPQGIISQFTAALPVNSFNYIEFITNFSKSNVQHKGEIFCKTSDVK